VSRHAAARGRRARRAAAAAPPVPPVPGHDVIDGRRRASNGSRPDPAVIRDLMPGPAEEGEDVGATRWVPPGEHVAPLTRAAARRLHLLAAGAAVAAGVVLGGGAVAGRPGVLVTVALAQAVLAPVWMLGTDRPGRIGGVLIGLAAAAAGDLALVLQDRTSPAVLLGVLGLALPAMVVHQLVRGVVRVRVTESVAAVALLVGAEVAACLPVALARADDGHRLVGTVVLGATAGLALARLTDALAPVPRIAAGVPYGLGAVVLAAVAGAAAGATAAGGPLGAGAGAGVGALVGAVAALVSVGVGFVVLALPDRPRPLVPALLSVLLPVALVAPVGYLTVLSVAG
jgi:hypothetical protein